MGEPTNRGLYQPGLSIIYLNYITEMILQVTPQYGHLYNIGTIMIH